SQETKNAPAGRIACTLFRDPAGLLSRSQASSLSQRVTQCARAARGHFSFLVRRTQAALGPTHKKRKTPLRGRIACTLFRDSAGIRTQDPNIKSVMLYQLSYGIGPGREVAAWLQLWGYSPYLRSQR